jgi:hypothetical protein
MIINPSPERKPVMSTNRLYLQSLLRTWLASIMIIGASTGHVAAQFTYEFGIVDGSTLTPLTDISLLPDQAGQQVALLVSNTGGAVNITGWNAELAIAHGGPPLVGLGLSSPLDGGADGPKFENVDFFSGTVFSGIAGGLGSYIGGPTPVDPIGSVPQYLNMSFALLGTTTSVSLPSGLSLLATLTVTTAGFTGPQSWPLDIATADLGGQGIPEIQGATITVVPEPGQYALAFGLGLLFVAVRYRLRLLPKH